MNIGSLDRRIKIQTKTTTRDSEGGAVETWADSRTVWAKKEDIGGAKPYRGGALRPETTAVFTIRWIENLSALDRIVYRSTNYSILSIAEVGRKDGMTIQARTEDIAT